MFKLSIIDLSIIIAFLAICLAIGLYKTTKIKTLREFALGYKGISVTVLVCAIFASSIGAGSTIGVTGKIYEFGAIFVILQLILPFIWLINASIIGSNIEKFKDCMSLGEVMYKLYGTPGRWVTAIATIIRSLGYIAAQALAMGYVFHYFLGIDTGYGILIGYGIITVYAALGGIKAVIPTEIFKSAIILFIIPISYIVIFATTGGVESVKNQLPESHLSVKLSEYNIRLLTSFTLFYLLPTFYPAFIQRCLIARNPKQLKHALRMIALISLPVSAVFCVIAYKMRAAFPDIVPDEALLRFIALLPDVLRGLMVAGLIAIIMSIAEAEINATSVILVNDILRVLRPNMSKAKQLLALRVTTIILSFSSIAIIYFAKNILGLVWSIANFWGPVISIPALSGFLGFKTNSKSFIASVIVAILFTSIGRVVVGEFAIMSWSFGILGSTIGLFGMHYYQIFTGQIETQPRKTKDIIPTRLRSIILSLPQSSSKFIKTTFGLLEENPGHHRLEIRKFCIFTLSYYFLYSLDVTSNPGHKVFAYLLIIGYFFCMVLLFREFITTQRFLNKYLHYYWYFLLTFCLPFVSSYMLFIGLNEPFWVINGILSAFSLYLFVDARRFILLYSIGLICGFLLFKLAGHHFQSFEEITTVSSIAYVYLFFLFATLFFFRKREKEQEERIDTMHVFGGLMAHEVRSPLATMDMYAGHLGSLLEGVVANKQEEGEFYQVKLKKDELQMILDAGHTLKKISSRGISTVDNLLTSLKNAVVAADKKEYSIAECITHSMSEYKLENPDKEEAEIKIIEDFMFYGSLYHTKRMLFNLLNNAYKYGGRDVKIEIATEKNRLRFRDNGKGIPEEALPYIFDKFYTKSQTGTGIGLSFCKMVMKDIGGDIECKSELGKYTEFVMYFPRVKKKKR